VNTRVHICRFDSAGDVTGKRRTYENVKVAVLKAGRFSVFEATENQKSAQIFMDIERDPDLETFEMAFPWRGVRLKPLPTAAPSQEGGA
jgi:hypothetical protein